MFAVNDYPGYAGQTWDPYGYAARQCASFANWRCMHDLGLPAIHNPNGNDGGKFAATLRDLYSIPTDGTPRVHDIVSFPAYTSGTGQYGHVAAVLALQGASVLVEDYNWDEQGHYAQHLMPVAGAQFAHVGGTGMSSAEFQQLQTELDQFKQATQEEITQLQKEFNDLRGAEQADVAALQAKIAAIGGGGVTITQVKAEIANSKVVPQ